MSSFLPQVIVLIGATASGKTELAIEIAEYFKTHIHNIDSRQIYKSMNIGTAKPSEKQQKKIIIQSFFIQLLTIILQNIWLIKAMKRKFLALEF